MVQPATPEDKEVALLKRLLTVLAVALVMAALVVATVIPAFAQGGGIKEERTNPAGNETQGQGKAITVTNVNPAGKAPPGQN
jgi:uncharacterized protein YdeI (BOF family)